VFDAARRVVTLVAAEYDERREPEFLYSLGELQTVLERMFRREDGDDSRTIRVSSQVDCHVAQIGFFAAANSAIREEDVTS
jgi:hypothetical protein